MPEPIKGMTVREAATKWGVTPQRIYQLRARKRIRCTFSAEGHLIVLNTERPAILIGGRPVAREV